MFERGSTVVWRSRPRGVIGYVVPFVVIEDSGDLVALWQPPGALCKHRSGRRGGPQGRLMVEWDGGHEDRIWQPPGSTWVHRMGDNYSVFRSWDDGFHGWYINLDADWVRTPIGFDSADHILDVAVEPDMSAWRWKDEDELAWAVETSLVTPAEADGFYEDGRAAIAALEARAFPFDDAAWKRFEPDPTWPIPVLPDDWDKV